MAFKSVGHMLFPPRVGGDAGGTVALIDAAGEKVAWIFRAPKTGNISNFYFRLATTTTGQTLKGSAQDVDTATGSADGTIDQSGTVSVANADDNVWKQITFGASRAVSMNDLVAIVAEFDSTIGNLNISRSTNVSGLQGFAYSEHFVSAAWSRGNGAPYIAVGYDDGTYPQIIGCNAGYQGTVINFSSSSTPDEVGNLIIPRAPMRVCGAYYHGRHTADMQFVLYEGASVTPVAVRTSDTFNGAVDSSLSDTYFYGCFDTPFDLKVGETYRIVLLPTTTSVIGRYDMVFANATILNGQDLGADCVKTSRVNGGNFAEDTAARVICGLIVSHISDGLTPKPYLIGSLR
jgi:hypothetical protein